MTQKIKKQIREQIEKNYTAVKVLCEGQRMTHREANRRYLSKCTAEEKEFELAVQKIKKAQRRQELADHFNSRAP